MTGKGGWWFTYVRYVENNYLLARACTWCIQIYCDMCAVFIYALPYDVTLIYFKLFWNRISHMWHLDCDNTCNKYFTLEYLAIFKINKFARTVNKSVNSCAWWITNVPFLYTNNALPKGRPLLTTRALSGCTTRQWILKRQLPIRIKIFSTVHSSDYALYLRGVLPILSPQVLIYQFWSYWKEYKKKTIIRHGSYLTNRGNNTFYSKQTKGWQYRWELPVLHYHEIIVICLYPFLVVITQFFSWIICINDCICILTGSPE